jgi:hypothetical protein
VEKWFPGRGRGSRVPSSLVHSLICSRIPLYIYYLILCRSRDVKARKDGFVLNELAGPGVCSRAAPREEALGSRKPPVRAQTPARAYGPIRTMANLVTIYI